MEITFGYGKTEQTAEIPDTHSLKILRANRMEHERTGDEAVQYALTHPVRSEKLSELARSRRNAVIITSDITRPVPSAQILPLIVEELLDAGMKTSDITVVLALGSHRNHTEEEKKHLIGDLYGKIACEDSNERGYVHMGQTAFGTPVDIAARVAEADLRIAVGNVEFHYFAGYSGGYKAIMPGCSTYDAISVNHSRMTDENACAGKIEGNPVREDIEEAGKICGLDFIVNVVLDEEKKIVYAAAGDAIDAHREACAYLNRMYSCPIDEQADIVIVGQGGAPKDANLYQVQKALDNARHAVKPGGIIILVGSCTEGFGSKIFEEWLVSAPTPHSLIERIEKEFRLGGHKAAAIGITLKKADIFLVSEMPDEVVETIFMKPFHSLQSASEEAIRRCGSSAKILSMPFGGSTLPVLRAGS